MISQPPARLPKVHRAGAQLCIGPARAQNEAARGFWSNLAMLIGRQSTKIWNLLWVYGIWYSINVYVYIYIYCVYYVSYMQRGSWTFIEYKWYKQPFQFHDKDTGWCRDIIVTHTQKDRNVFPRGYGLYLLYIYIIYIYSFNIMFKFPTFPPMLELLYF